MNRTNETNDNTTRSYLLHEIVLETARRHPEKTALMYRGDSPEFKEITFHELVSTIDMMAAGLTDLGIGKGDRVAILAGNSPKWAIADLASLRLGAIVVPIYQTLPPVAIKHILADSGAKLIFVGDKESYEKIAGIRAELPDLTQIVGFDKEGIPDSKLALPPPPMILKPPEKAHLSILNAA